MKWALICGASGDIGQQIAVDLAAEGWSLYLHYHRATAKIMTLVEKLTQAHPKQDFIMFKQDMTDQGSAEQIASQIFTSLDAVIFAQGTTEYGLFRNLSPTKFDQMLAMQLQTPLRLIALLEDKLVQSEAGRIVFIGSVYGGNGSALEVGYSTLKGALSAFCSAYSKEVASTGLTVNVIAPGAVKTQMNMTFSAEEKAEVAETIPKGRFAVPKEISYFVKSLLPKEAGYLTGQTLYVTGGWLR